MRALVLSVLGVGSLAMSACQHGGILNPGKARPPSLVPVSQVMNAIKCELAETFSGGRYLDFVKQDEQHNKDINGVLGLNNVVAFSRSVEGGGEVVVPLGITFGPSISHARTATTGQSYEIKFSYNLVQDSGIPAFCAALAREIRVEGDPFVTMLEGMKAEHGKIQAGDPKVQFGTIGYTSKFEIKQEETAGAKLKFLVFSLGGKASNTRTEGQSLTLIFDLSLAPALIAHQE